MVATQCTDRLPFKIDVQTVRPRARRRDPHRGGTQGWVLVIVAHLASLLSVGAFVIGLTFGSIATAKRCIGSDAVHGQSVPAPDDGGGSHPGATEAVTRSVR